ncbi:MAG: hypothetical protein U5L04_02485 [Trueperaceae bacterium]|nr:hypothetical protein [Trueperaceae bacterium]
MKRKTTSVSSTDSTDSGRAGRPAREDSDDDTSPKQQELTPTTNDEPDDLATWMYRTAQNQGYDLTYEQAGAMVMRMMNRKLTDEECRELFVDSLAQAIAVEKPPAKWAYYFGSKEHVEMWRGDVNPSRSGVGKGKRDFQADGSTRKALEECEIATAEDNEQAFKDAGLE